MVPHFSSGHVVSRRVAAGEANVATCRRHGAARDFGKCRKECRDILAQGKIEPTFLRFSGRVPWDRNASYLHFARLAERRTLRLHVLINPGGITV